MRWPIRKTQNRFSESTKKPKPHGGVSGLNCYKLAVEIFRDPILGLGAEATFFEHTLHARIAQLQIKVLEHLGAGYHTFGSVKAAEYAKARAAAGSLLALLSSGFAGLLVQRCAALEQKLLPCLIALQRSAEKTRAANSARI